MIRQRAAGLRLHRAILYCHIISRRLAPPDIASAPAASAAAEMKVGFDAIADAIDASSSLRPTDVVKTHAQTIILPARLLRSISSPRRAGHFSILAGAFRRAPLPVRHFGDAFCESPIFSFGRRRQGDRFRRPRVAYRRPAWSSRPTTTTNAWRASILWSPAIAMPLRQRDAEPRQKSRKNGIPVIT